MRRSTLTGTALAALAALFATSWMGTAGADKKGGYVETDLVTNKAPLTDKNGIVHPVNNPKAIVDGKLQNPWGLTESATSPFWVSDNAIGFETLYNVPGTTPLVASKNPLEVSVPLPGSLGGGAPTGNVFNTTVNLPMSQQEFMISGFSQTTGCKTNTTKATARFLFATEDGTIVGWAPTLYPTQDLCTAGGTSTNGIIAVDNSARGQGGGQGVGTGKGKGNGLSAVYKGLAIATDATGTFLYVTNFRAGRVEKYDGTFALVDTFTDKKVPPRYAPFNISLINGKLFVTFAVQNAERHDDVAGAGNGIVDTFDLSGNMLQRFAEHGALNSPWGLTITPALFGDLGGGKLWIGNFGNGQINAFDAATGAFAGTVNKPCVAACTAQPILIDGLWSIRFGNDGPGGSSNTLYFTAGPNGETDGVFGALSPHP